MKFLKTFLLIITLTVMSWTISACKSADGSTSVSLNTQNSRILNGSPVENTEIPQLVAIRTQLEDSDELCTGVVLDSQHVLTAGHCVLNATTVYVDSVVGTFLAENVTLHPEYFENSEVSAIFNDVAILSFDHIPLPSLPLVASKQITAPTQAVVYGYGITKSGSSGMLEGGLVDIAQITANHFVGSTFSGKEATPCNGDSGAPLIHTFDLNGQQVTGVAALVSTGTTPDCTSGDVTFYSNLQNIGIVNFILSEAPNTALL